MKQIGNKNSFQFSVLGCRLVWVGVLCVGNYGSRFSGFSVFGFQFYYITHIVIFNCNRKFAS